MQKSLIKASSFWMFTLLLMQQHGRNGINSRWLNVLFCVFHGAILLPCIGFKTVAIIQEVFGVLHSLKTIWKKNSQAILYRQVKFWGKKNGWTPSPSPYGFTMISNIGDPPKLNLTQRHWWQHKRICDVRCKKYFTNFHGASSFK